MVINLTDDAPRISYTVSTSTATFQVPFEFFDAEDLVVVVGGTTKTLTTHYTVNQNTDKTGSITMTSGNEVSSGTVIIFRNIPFKRTTDFPTSGSFDMDTLNTELDRNIALFDDQQDRIDRAVRLNDNDDAASMVLPLKASRVGTVLGFNATTGAAEAGPTIANVNSLADITTNINTVAGISSNVTTVAGISSNVTTVAGISSAVSSVAGVASLITSDFVSDLNTLATSAIVEDLNILATTDIVSDLNQLATSDFVSDLNSVEGIKANVTSVGNNIANVNTVATQLTSSSPTFTNTVTASAYTTSGGGTFFIGNTSFRQTGLKNTSGELDIDASSNIKLTTNTGVINLFNDDTYFGRFNQDGNGELVISSGNDSGGGDPTVALTFSGANATFAGTINTTSTNKIQFGDSGTYIHQSADGVLDLVSDTEIEINATTIDMNGNLDVSGSATIGTDVTSASGNFVTSGSNIALKHSSGENFFTATKDGGSAMYHDALPVFNTVSTNGGAVGTTNANTFTLDSSNTFFEVGATNAGTIVLSAQTNNNATNVGDIRFANANNGDDDGVDADGKMIARIISQTVTSDSNASDDSGGTIVFSTKPEAGSIATALTLGSDQSATFNGTVKVSGTSFAALRLNEGDTTNVNTSLFNSSGDFVITTSSDDGSSTTDRIRLDHATGDISFYEDTGSNVKFFWDASEERLGIGTTSPSDPLEIVTSGSNGIRLSVSGQSYYHEVRSNGDGLLISADDSDAGGSGADIRFNVANDEKMRLNHDGALMVGTTDVSAYNNNAESTADNALVYDTYAFSLARYNGTVSYINRTGSSNGALFEFRKNGSAIGYIKTNDYGEYNIASVANLTFEQQSGTDRSINFGTDHFGPFVGDGDAVDLGRSSAKWRNLYLSGGVDCAEITYDKVNNSAGNSGLNVNAQYSYDDNNENSIGSYFHNNHTFIYINTNAGFTVVPVLSNGGAGIAWANYLWDPDNQTWTSANDMTFTQSGTSGNTFRIRISAGQGTGTIERTSGSMAYQVYISRPAGGS